MVEQNNYGMIKWLNIQLSRKNTKIEAPKFLIKSMFESLIQCELVCNVWLRKKLILPLRIYPNYKQITEL